MRISWGRMQGKGFSIERSRCAGGLFQWHSICRSALLIHVQAIKRLPWYSSWSSGISAPLRTCTRRGGRCAWLSAHGHGPGLPARGIVRRNISPEAFRNLVAVRVPATGVERPPSEHGSQVRLRVLAVNFLQSQMHRTLCTCVTAVGTWARWPPARALGPHTPFRAHPVPFSSCWCLARAGQGMQGVVWRGVLAPCPGASRFRLGARLFLACPYSRPWRASTSSFGRWPGTSSEAQTSWACASRTTLRPWHAWAA